MKWKEVLNVLAFVLLIAAVVGVIVVFALAENRREKICVEHGYVCIGVIGGQYVCIGFRDGNTIVTPFDQVKEIK